MVFDHSKLRTLVLDFQTTIPFVEGIFETIEWFDSDPRRPEIDYEVNVL